MSTHVRSSKQTVGTLLAQILLEFLPSFLNSLYIRPKNHRLTSRGLPSDDKRWSRGTDASIQSSDEKWIFFLLTTKCLILYWKTNTKIFPENPVYAKMRLGDVILTLPWRHGEKTKKTCIGCFHYRYKKTNNRLICFYLPHQKYEKSLFVVN